jgi:hypothetical protein
MLRRVRIWLHPPPRSRKGRSLGGALSREQAVVRHPRLHGRVSLGTGPRRRLCFHGHDAARPHLDVPAQRQARRLHPRASQVQRPPRRPLLESALGRADGKVCRHAAPSGSASQGRERTGQACAVRPAGSRECAAPDRLESQAWLSNPELRPKFHTLSLPKTFEPTIRSRSAGTDLPRKNHTELGHCREGRGPDDWSVCTTCH